MKNLKFYCLLVLLVFGFLFVYFVKCQLDICLIKHFPLDKYPPLSLLQNRNPDHIIHAPQANVDLFSNRFAFEAGIWKWKDLWMQEKGTVTIKYGGMHDHLPVLVITSRSAKGWSLDHRRLIEVNPGEVYGFSGWARTSGKEVIGTLSVILYDGERHVKQWQFAEGSVTGANNWQKVNREFTVPFGVRYVRFHLTGTGVGKTCFDGIKFKKEK